MKKLFKSKILATGLMLILSISSLAGAAPNEVYAATASNRQNSKDTAGSILLSVNPEIKISYDKRGNVTVIKGLNDDGQNVLKKYTNYEGDSSETVVKELIGRMDDGGYLNASINGHRKNILIKLSRLSQVPDVKFLDNVANAARKELSDRNLDLRVIIIDSDDYEPNYQDKEFINYETAKQIIKDQLHLENITFLEKDYDIDDGVYELEFTSDNVKYECEINAFTGNIIKVERDGVRHYDDRHDHDDRYDYDDDRYDHDDDRYDHDRYDD